MYIWFDKSLTIEKLQSYDQNNMVGYLGIRFSEVGDDFIKAKMPVDNRTTQIYGILHGGASVTLAESVGSIGSGMVIDPAKNICVGQEINANHLRSVRTGFVTAHASPLHLGKMSHVWDIKIFDDQDKLVCVSRLTVAILPLNKT